MALKRSAVRDRYAPPFLQAHPFDGLFCLWDLGLRGFVEACFWDAGCWRPYGRRVEMGSGFEC